MRWLRRLVALQAVCGSSELGEGRRGGLEGESLVREVKRNAQQGAAGAGSDGTGLQGERRGERGEERREESRRGEESRAEESRRGEERRAEESRRGEERRGEEGGVGSGAHRKGGCMSGRDSGHRGVKTRDRNCRVEGGKQQSVVAGDGKRREARVSVRVCMCEPSAPQAPDGSLWRRPRRCLLAPMGAVCRAHAKCGRGLRQTAAGRCDS